MLYALAVLIGAVVGYSFRGYISKEKKAAGAAVGAAVIKEASKL